MSFNWECPHCNTKTTIGDSNFHTSDDTMAIGNSEGSRILRNEWIICPNKECKKITLTVILYSTKQNPINYRNEKDKILQYWYLMPDSLAKVFPSYIPKALLDDYNEASKILNLSPKASATLSRRCIQGIIRDFWKVSKPRLIDEINAIEDKIDPLTWKSIDAIRKVGNIGAHMEKDINLIIDVDPKEAHLLIQLIELLFEEWYIHRHEREQKLRGIIEIADKKDAQKKSK